MRRSVRKAEHSQAACEARSVARPLHYPLINFGLTQPQAGEIRARKRIPQLRVEQTRSVRNLASRTGFVGVPRTRQMKGDRARRGRAAYPDRRTPHITSSGCPGLAGHHRTSSADPARRGPARYVRAPAQTLESDSHGEPTGWILRRQQRRAGALTPQTVAVTFPRTRRLSTCRAWRWSSHPTESSPRKATPMNWFKFFRLVRQQETRIRSLRPRTARAASCTIMRLE